MQHILSTLRSRANNARYIWFGFNRTWVSAPTNNIRNVGICNKWYETIILLSIYTQPLDTYLNKTHLEESLNFSLDFDLIVIKDLFCNP